jgi:uncharacterized protein (TIGR02266 family)
LKLFKEKRRGGDRAKVEIDIDLATFGHYDLSKLTNVSIGGAFIRTGHVQPVGTKVGLTFRLPGDSRPIEALGEVMWVYNQPGSPRMNATGMGIRFVEIDPADRNRIGAFVDAATREEITT